MTKYKTLCRWCGGEMRLITRGDDHFPSLPPYYLWRCTCCYCESNAMPTEAEALEWASQPIPFLPEKYSNLDKGVITLTHPFITKIESALAVREEEQK